MTKIVDSSKVSQTENPGKSLENVNQEVHEERRRVPMSIPRAKLHCPDIPNYHCHWFNDTPGRIQQAVSAGYEFVLDSEVNISHNSIGSAVSSHGNTDFGGKISLVVGKGDNGEGLRAYLMKIPEKYFLEDQKVLEVRNDQIEQAIRQGSIGADQDSNNDRGSRYSRVDYQTNSKR